MTAKFEANYCCTNEKQADFQQQQTIVCCYFNMFICIEWVNTLYWLPIIEYKIKISPPFLKPSWGLRKGGLIRL